VAWDGQKATYHEGISDQQMVTEKGGVAHDYTKCSLIVADRMVRKADKGSIQVYIRQLTSPSLQFFDQFRQHLRSIVC
jgi:hypothetical protein